MRATIVAGRVFAAVLLLWAGVSAFWTVKTLFFSGHEAFVVENLGLLTNEVFFHHFAIPVMGAGLAICLLLLASILDELRRRPE